MKRAFLLLPVVVLLLAAQTPLGGRLAELTRALTQGDRPAIDRITAEVLASDARVDDLLTLGGLLGEREYLEPSAQVFEQCAARYPNSFEGHYNLALARLALHQNGKASEALAAARPASPDQHAAVSYLRGKIYAATDQLKEARDHLESAYAARQDEENYALDLAMLDLRSAAYVPAIQILQKASRYHPDSQQIDLELALAYALAGKEADAIAASRKLEKEQSDSPLPALVATFAECSTGNYRNCSNEAERGLRSLHPHPYLYYLHALAEWNNGSPDPAAIQQELKRALTEMPACQVCLQLRSRVLESTANYPAAIADLEAAVALDATSASSWYRLAELCRKTKQPTKSAEAMSRFRALHSDQAAEEMESFRRQVFPTR